MNKRLVQVLAQMNPVWPIRSGVLEAIASPGAKGAAGAGGQKLRKVNGSVAVIPIAGITTQRDRWWGTCTEDLSKWVDEAMRDRSVGAIVYQCDSPGGNLEGVIETSAKIYGYRGTKPQIAVVDSESASANYWLASSADQMIITPGGWCGSVGCYILHIEIAKALADAGYGLTLIKYGEHKAEANPWFTLEESARAHLQAACDEIGKKFERDVARNRGVSPVTVHETFGQGRMFLAKEAVALGLCDRIATFAEVVAELAGQSDTDPRIRSMESALASLRRPAAKVVHPRNARCDSLIAQMEDGLN